MATKINFLWKNYFNSAIITASSSAADYPVELLQNRWKDSSWRTEQADSSGEWVVADLGSPLAIGAFVFENMNLREGAELYLQANDADDWFGSGDPLYGLYIAITAEMVENRKVVVILNAPETYRWWRILMADPGNPDGYLSASLSYLGPTFEPRYSFQSPWTKTRVSHSEISASIGEQTSANKRPKFWTYSLKIQIVGESDAESFADIDEECGIDTPLWICLDPTDIIKTTIYALFTSHMEFSTISRKSLWETVLNFKEEL